MAVAGAVGLLVVAAIYEPTSLGYEVRLAEVVSYGFVMWVPLAFALVLVAQAVLHRLPNAAGFVQLLVLAMVIAQGVTMMAAWMGMR